jgi:hypothetical protein
MTAFRPAPQLPRQQVVRVSGQLPFPRIAPLSALALRGKALDSLCGRAHPTAAASLRRFVFRATSATPEMLAGYAGLHDELCSYLGSPPVFQSDWALAKVRTEFAVYSRMAGHGDSILQASEGDFVDLLVEIHRRLGTGANALRTHSVATACDGAGNRVVFPHFDQCLPLLRDLHGFVRANAGRYPTLCAMAAYVGINHAHPFTDGNGRTARAAYNLIVAASSGSRHFLPIHGFNALARGGLIIKVRRAMYGGDWAPLLAFLADATRLSDRLQREEP